MPIQNLQIIKACEIILFIGISVNLNGILLSYFDLLKHII
jgi:hypothetical protein